MTAGKDFKRLVRARMAKTGESYTTARSQLKKPHAPRPTSHAPDYAALAGMSDEKVKAATGRDWKEWTAQLDSVDAASWQHSKTAEWLHTEHAVRPWWTQMVTVGYERIKGKRAIGQRLGGSWEATRSRTLPVPITKLFNAWNVKKRRDAWLGEPDITIRKAMKNRSMRITWNDGTSVALWFQAPAKAKSQVAVQHGKLASKADADRCKKYWGEKLESLAGYLLRT